MTTSDEQVPEPISAEKDAAARKWLERVGRDRTPEAIAALAPYVAPRNAEQGTPRSGAWISLVRRGQTPTDEAIDRIVAHERKHREAKETADALAADRAMGAAIAEFIAAHVQETGVGPRWSDVRRQFGWTHAFGPYAMHALQHAGWVTFTREPGSLRPGPGPTPGQ